jgi:hypothetical protein
LSPTTEEGKVRAASDVNRSEGRQANKLLGAAEHEQPNVRKVKRVTQVGAKEGRVELKRMADRSEVNRKAGQSMGC